MTDDDRSSSNVGCLFPSRTDQRFFLKPIAAETVLVPSLLDPISDSFRRNRRQFRAALSLYYHNFLSVTVSSTTTGSSTKAMNHPDKTKKKKKNKTKHKAPPKGKKREEKLLFLRKLFLCH